MAAASAITFFNSRQYNSVTREVQRVDLTVQQEVALGVQAAPQVEKLHGGLTNDTTAQARVEDVGNWLVKSTDASNTRYKFEFHVLAKGSDLDAFTLPSGHVFVSSELLDRLHTEGALAAVLAHQIGHVVARHAAENLTRARLTVDLPAAPAIAASDPSEAKAGDTAQLNSAIDELSAMRYDRRQESEADSLAVRFLTDAGYDPQALLAVLEVFDSPGHQQVTPAQFQAGDDHLELRRRHIEAAIAAVFPSGVPDNLVK